MALPGELTSATALQTQSRPLFADLAESQTKRIKFSRPQERAMLSTTSPASLQEPFINTVLRNSILIKERIALALAELKQLQNGNGDLNGVMANHGSSQIVKIQISLVMESVAFGANPRPVPLPSVRSLDQSVCATPPPKR
jgi:hypothetical protein